MRHWLMKSEPDVYSFSRLVKDETTLWEGVRNYQARNFMRDEMTKGDLVLFYHSNATPPGVAGVAEVARAAVPDPTQFDAKSEYYDASSKKDDPRWVCVEVRAKDALPRVVALDELKANPKLAKMGVVQKGQRLSVMPVTADEFAEVLRMAKKKP